MLFRSLIDSCQENVCGVNASLDKSLTQLPPQIVRPAIGHYHLDLLARLHGVQQHPFHQLGVGVGQDDVSIPDLLVGCLRDGFGMKSKIYVDEVINNFL